MKPTFTILIIFSRYYKEELAVHVLAHAVYLTVLEIDSTFEAKLQSAFDSASNAGLWENTYAITNCNLSVYYLLNLRYCWVIYIINFILDVEYFAEAVQSYFRVNAESDEPDGIHNSVNGKRSLSHYDHKIFELVHDVFPCPNQIIGKCSHKLGKFDLIFHDLTAAPRGVELLKSIYRMYREQMYRFLNLE